MDVGGVSVFDGGVSVFVGGVSVLVGGVSVDVGGVSVFDGGVSVEVGGVSVLVGGVLVDVDGVSVFVGGVLVSSPPERRMEPSSMWMKSVGISGPRVMIFRTTMPSRWLSQVTSIEPSALTFSTTPTWPSL